ncbi:ion channel activity [Mycoblastus sanguinarius]|nr:ion channel activity [Mycoblastus sanguinarius]
MTGNDAIHANGDHSVNGGTSDIAITNHGSDWYFAVCAVMFVSTIAFAGLSFTKPRPHRIFHYITASITMVAAIAYFTMGADLGETGIKPEFMRSNPKVAGNLREIFYVRYIDWVITTPLLLMDLLLTAGLPWPTILYTVLIDEIMIITGLIGALVTSSYKWGYFTFGCVAFLWVAWTVTWTARKHAAAIGPDVSRTYLICGVWTIFLWFLYPIAWGLSEGGNVIAPDSEAVFYGILDLMAKPVFGALLLWGHRGIDPARLGLHIRDYDDPISNSAYDGTEKHTNGANNGINNGVNNGVTAGATTTGAEV